jgi:hypothetical protein
MLETRSKIPMPGDIVILTDNRGKIMEPVKRICVASCYHEDTMTTEKYLVIVLLPQSPYYAVEILESKDDGAYRYLYREVFRNINYAVEHYAQMGGDV